MSPDAILAAVAADAAVTHVAVVHHETTAGVLNPVAEIGVRLSEFRSMFGRDIVLIVDSMSAFGAYDINLATACVDYLVSSANKCIEGVPGFAFALCSKARLEGTAGNARSLSLDLYEQWRGLEATAQFRFTPPTHALLAFSQVRLARVVIVSVLFVSFDGKYALVSLGCDSTTRSSSCLPYHVPQVHPGATGTDGAYGRRWRSWPPCSVSCYNI